MLTFRLRGIRGYHATMLGISDDVCGPFANFDEFAIQSSRHHSRNVIPRLNHYVESFEGAAQTTRHSGAVLAWPQLPYTLRCDCNGDSRKVCI